MIESIAAHTSKFYEFAKTKNLCHLYAIDAVSLCKVTSVSDRDTSFDFLLDVKNFTT